MEKNLKKRMYFLTMYNISDIQKSLQCGHAALEYAYKYKDTEEVWDFIKNHKTWVILNGGTSNDATQSFYGLEKENGSMEQHALALFENKVQFSKFYEPDLNYSLSAICLIVDERVFNKEDYPEFPQYLAQAREDFTFNFGGAPLEEEYPEDYKKWVELMGGKKNVFLKEFLSSFRLA